MTNEPDFRIRDGSRGDLEEVGALMRSAYQEFEFDVSPEFANDFLEDAAKVHSQFEESELIVAELGGRLVGVVTLYLDGTKYAEGWPPTWPAIRLLGVDPEQRGKGIGKALVFECLKRARRGGAQRVGLHTTPFMLPAQKMYESMGFRHDPSIDYAFPEFKVKGYLINL